MALQGLNGHQRQQANKLCQSLLDHEHQLYTHLDIQNGSGGGDDQSDTGSDIFGSEFNSSYPDSLNDGDMDHFSDVTGSINGDITNGLEDMSISGCASVNGDYVSEASGCLGNDYSVLHDVTSPGPDSPSPSLATDSSASSSALDNHPGDSSTTGHQFAVNRKVVPAVISATAEVSNVPDVPAAQERPSLTSSVQRKTTKKASGKEMARKASRDLIRERNDTTGGVRRSLKREHMMIKWIMRITHLDKDMSVDFADWVQDGTVLTQVMTTLCFNSVERDKYPAAGCSPEEERIKALRPQILDYGVDPKYLFQVNDILYKKNTCKVIRCLEEVAKLAKKETHIKLDTLLSNKLYT